MLTTVLKIPPSVPAASSKSASENCIRSQDPPATPRFAPSARVIPIASDLPTRPPPVPPALRRPFRQCPRRPFRQCPRRPFRQCPAQPLLSVYHSYLVSLAPLRS